MIRMKFVVQYNATFDATWDNVDITVWSAIEQFPAMFCGSLPALRPLFVHVHRRASAEVSRRIDSTPSRALPSKNPIPAQSLPRQTWNIQAAGTQADSGCIGNQVGQDDIWVTTAVQVETWFEDGSQHRDRGIEGSSVLAVYPSGTGSPNTQDENRHQPVDRAS